MKEEHVLFKDTWLYGIELIMLKDQSDSKRKTSISCLYVVNIQMYIVWMRDYYQNSLQFSGNWLVASIKVSAMCM